VHVFVEAFVLPLMYCMVAEMTRQLNRLSLMVVRIVMSIVHPTEGIAGFCLIYCLSMFSHTPFLQFCTAADASSS
jgi:hypothetical protein